MALTFDAIVAKFPVKITPTITGEPDYDAINQMVQRSTATQPHLQQHSGEEHMATSAT
jgi:hypothetical protein